VHWGGGEIWRFLGGSTRPTYQLDTRLFGGGGDKEKLKQKATGTHTRGEAKRRGNRNGSGDLVVVVGWGFGGTWGQVETLEKDLGKKKGSRFELAT